MQPLITGNLKMLAAGEGRVAAMGTDVKRPARAQAQGVFGGLRKVLSLRGQAPHASAGPGSPAGPASAAGSSTRKRGLMDFEPVVLPSPSSASRVAAGTPQQTPADGQGGTPRPPVAMKNLFGAGKRNEATYGDRASAAAADASAAAAPLATVVPATRARRPGAKQPMAGRIRAAALAVPPDAMADPVPAVAAEAGSAASSYAARCDLAAAEVSSGTPSTAVSAAAYPARVEAAAEAVSAGYAASPPAPLATGAQQAAQTLEPSLPVAPAARALAATASATTASAGAVNSSPAPSPATSYAARAEAISAAAAGSPRPAPAPAASYAARVETAIAGTEAASAGAVGSSPAAAGSYAARAEAAAAEAEAASAGAQRPGVASNEVDLELAEGQGDSIPPEVAPKAAGSVPAPRQGTLTGWMPWNQPPRATRAMGAVPSAGAGQQPEGAAAAVARPRGLRHLLSRQQQPAVAQQERAVEPLCTAAATFLLPEEPGDADAQAAFEQRPAAVGLQVPTLPPASSRPGVHSSQVNLGVTLPEVPECCLQKTLPDLGCNCSIQVPDQPQQSCTLQDLDQAAGARGVLASSSGIHYPQLPSTAAQQQGLLYPAVAVGEVPTPQVLSEEDSVIEPDGYTDGSRQDPPAASMHARH